MPRELHWSLVVTRSPILDGEGKITIERTSIQRLVKQAFDAGAEEAMRQRIKNDAPPAFPFNPFNDIFHPKG